MNLLLFIQKTNKESDPLQWMFTLFLSLFPAIVLTAILVVFYMIVKLIVLKKGLIKTTKNKGLVFLIFTFIFSILTLIVCIKWEFWSSINMAIPYIIMSYLFMKNAAKIGFHSKGIRINKIILLVAIGIGVFQNFI